jgi:hypothetical protein
MTIDNNQAHLYKIMPYQKKKKNKIMPPTIQGMITLTKFTSLN